VYTQASFGALIVASLSIGAPAFAQSSTDAPNSAQEASTTSGGDILVTARRKSENILKTPIAIKALTAEDLAARGSATIQDIAQSTPGLNVQQSSVGGARADRSAVSIQLRGFTPPSSAAQTTSVFIDGAPVSTATALQALTNPERVEVIKGPQSALFGRQTFAGAINVVTKQPSEDLSGSVSVSGGTRNNYDAQLEVSAPIVKDVLSFRASVRAFGKDGSYENRGVPGQTLGDQSTKTGSLAIRFTPTERLTVKLFGLYTKLDDGPAATGLISAYNTRTGFGTGAVVSQSNCNITSSTGVVNPFFCGTVPGLSATTPSANVTSPSIVTFLKRTAGRVLSPSDGVHGYGLVNRYYHAHANIDYALGDSGVTLSSLTSYNKELKSELADLDNFESSSVTALVAGRTSYPDGYYNFDFLIENRARDFSQELRTSFENGGPLHASFGGSYLVARSQGDQGSAYLNQLTAAGATQNRTYGVFGSVGYDFNSQFTLSADARYQIDKLYAFAGPAGTTFLGAVVPANALVTSAKFKNFLPRFIGQFNLTSHNMFYASFSKGVNPGAFNTTSPSSPEPQVRAQFFANGYDVAVKPEKITNYEIGAKGRLGPVRYDAAAFYAIWSNQIQTQSTILVKNGTDSGPAPAGSVLQVTASVNTGKVRIYGLEANTSVDLARGLTFELSGAYIKTYILSATNAAVSGFYNIPASGFRGKENPFISKHSGTASLAYETPISDTAKAFGRVDFSYKSGGYTDVSNFSKTRDTTQVNLRAGVKNGTLSIEGYVTNLFNNLAFYNANSGSLLLPGVTTGQYGALLAQLRDKRTIGARATFKF
jgi:iron complex outermembrane receptor protein